MKKYAIGLCSFEEDIEVVIMEAESGLMAMRNVVVEKYQWDVLEEGELPFDNEDEAIDFFLQGDINISKPVEI